MNEGCWPDGEYVNWKDTGCALHPSCLACPLERCIEEVPRGRQRQRMSDRAAEMAALRAQGHTVPQVAAAFGLSVRSVQRSLQKHRNNGNGHKGRKKNPKLKIQDPNTGGKS